MLFDVTFVKQHNPCILILIRINVLELNPIDKSRYFRIWFHSHKVIPKLFSYFTKRYRKSNQIRVLEISGNVKLHLGDPVYVCWHFCPHNWIYGRRPFCIQTRKNSISFGQILQHFWQMLHISWQMSKFFRTVNSSYARIFFQRFQNWNRITHWFTQKTLCKLK